MGVMSNALQRITPWLAGAALAVSLSGCGTSSSEQPTAPDPMAPPATMLEATPPGSGAPDTSTQPADPGDPAEDNGEVLTFEGEVSTDTITANMMEMEIASGIRIPEDTLVTKAEPPTIMMADEDPAAVIAMVESSAAEAGYEVYAEIPGGKVFVGNGNAVHFTAGPQFQILTWGPEAMKDVLANS